jgi:2-deoxy-D-gluconate 3-dehydrogenase
MGILDRFRLDGKTALVTGCSRGIGEAIAIGLAETGADIVGVSKTLEPGSRVERAVQAAGRKFNSYACDFSDRRQLHAFIHKVKAEHPVIDILINNAGTVLRKPAEEHSDEYWDHVLEVNLSAQFVLSREIGKGMLARKSGKIVFTASLLSFQVAAVAKALANEWAGKGVNINAIAPGYIRTDNTKALREDPVRSQAILTRIPAGRWGDPQDLVGAVVFLASAASDYVNGTVLTVDGGWMGR